MFLAAVCDDGNIRDADLRQWGAGGLLGKPLPRLDLPAKSDGSLRFAGDVRLPHMVLAAVQMAPPGGELKGFSRAAAERQKGLHELVVTRRWIAAIGETWWAAEQALKAARPRFTGSATPDTMTVLKEALENGSAAESRTLELVALHKAQDDFSGVERALLRGLERLPQSEALHAERVQWYRQHDAWDKLAEALCDHAMHLGDASQKREQIEQAALIYERQLSDPRRAARVRPSSASRTFAMAVSRVNGGIRLIAKLHV